MSDTQLYVGTSGWSYQGWKKNFYPANIKDTEMLAFYSRIFTTVELNSSFYHLPREKTVIKWYDITPKEFIFACKASRYLTHIKKLGDYQAGLTRLFGVLDHLKEKLGPILFQLPPNWPYDGERLKHFINALSSSHEYTFEFRNKTWLCHETYDLLRQHNIALCFYDFKGFQAPEIITSDIIYLRLHGPKILPYQEHYSAASLKQYANKCKHWQNQVKKIYCYFDNDQKEAAPADAQTLINYWR